MAGFTKVNLKEDVDDQAPNFGLSPSLEMRMARVPLDMQNSGMSYQRIAPNFRMPFGHKHKTQEEVYVVLSGSLRMKIEDDVHDLKQWDAVRVDKDTMRSFEGGPEGAEMLAIGAPSTGPGDGDMVQGWWSGSEADSGSES
jgi:mannose-6-phosphate isomerase-like protein (cupin superfamily)